MRQVVAQNAEDRLVIRLKDLRGARTLSEVAKEIGMRQDDLGKIERGETQGIRYETILKLCGFFHVTLDELFTVEPAQIRRNSPLERALEKIDAGALHTHEVGERVRKLRPVEARIDVKAAAEFVDFEEPHEPRSRTRVPATVAR